MSTNPVFLSPSPKRKRSLQGSAVAVESKSTEISSVSSTDTVAAFDTTAATSSSAEKSSSKDPFSFAVSQFGGSFTVSSKRASETCDDLSNSSVSSSLSSLSESNGELSSSSSPFKMGTIMSSESDRVIDPFGLPPGSTPVPRAVSAEDTKEESTKKSTTMMTPSSSISLESSSSPFSFQRSSSVSSSPVTPPQTSDVSAIASQSHPSGLPDYEIERVDKAPFIAEFPSVQALSARFQFICEAYRDCKAGKPPNDTIRQQFSNCLSVLFERLFAKQQPIKPLKKWSDESEHIEDRGRPCDHCGNLIPKSDLISLISGCDHMFCGDCYLSLFRAAPAKKNVAFYVCRAMVKPKDSHNHCSDQRALKKKEDEDSEDKDEETAVNQSDDSLQYCHRLLHPSVHHFALKYGFQDSSDDNRQQSARMVYKNILKVMGEAFSQRLRRYPRWRSCLHCEFGFLADPGVDWQQRFELSCQVCRSTQRVQLLGPMPCPKVRLHGHFQPHSSMWRTMLFIRHGQAQNNVRRKGMTPEDVGIDPSLTEVGFKQCRQLRACLTGMMAVDLILVSPLQRTLQTASVAFSHLCARSPCSMESSEEAKSTLESTSSSVPWIALPCLRERLKYTFNERKRLSEKRVSFKHVSFEQCSDDSDQLFRVTRRNESYEAMNERAAEFWRFLWTREERRVAVVAHEGILSCLMHVVDSDSELRRPFRNAELRFAFVTLKSDV